MPSTKWLSAQELAAWRKLSLMNLQLNAQLSRELAGDGLSMQDYVVLAYLCDAVDGRARVVELGRQLGWEKSRVSHHISRMEQRGFVCRAKCPTDLRGSFVVITDQGREAITAAAPAHVAAVRRHFIDHLTTAQIKALDQIATTVLDALAEDCDHLD